MIYLPEIFPTELLTSAIDELSNNGSRLVRVQEKPFLMFIDEARMDISCHYALAFISDLLLHSCVHFTRRESNTYDRRLFDS